MAHSNPSVLAVTLTAVAAACASMGGLRSEPVDAGEVRYYVAPLSDVVAATRTVIQANDIEIEEAAPVDSTTWMLLGKKGMSLFSYGELVRVTVRQTQEGPVAVRVVSKRRDALNLMARNWTGTIFEQLDRILHHPPSRMNIRRGHMALFRKHTDFARLVAVVLAGTFLCACMTWQTQSLQPERFQDADSTQVVRLTLTGGDMLIVHSPVIAGDSLVGMRARAGASPDSLERVSIPLTAISQAEVQKVNSQSVVLGVVGIGLLVATFVAVANTCYAFCSGH